jgi:hypothetical protein
VLGVVAAKDNSHTDALVFELKFDHRKHERRKIDCAACHTAAATSTTGLDNLLPGHPQCIDCHDVDDEEECLTCHTTVPPLPNPHITDYSPKFDHALHVGVAKLECKLCHADLAKPLVLNKMGHLPTMTQCMSCHQDEAVTNECAACHRPTDDLVPANHKLDWMHFHGIAAAQSQQECMLCHTAVSTIAMDCNSCHNGDIVSSPHPRNYAARHGHDAHINAMNCVTCHSTQQFCNQCHNAMNILPADHFQPGWVTASGGTHGEQAKFDLQSCIACHDQPSAQPTCAACHGQ